jgi:hypothetical protein
MKLTYDDNSIVQTTCEHGRGRTSSKRKKKKKTWARRRWVRTGLV